MFKKLHLTPPYPALWFKFRPPLLILEPPPLQIIIAQSLTIIMMDTCFFLQTFFRFVIRRARRNVMFDRGILKHVRWGDLFSICRNKTNASSPFDFPIFTAEKSDKSLSHRTGCRPRFNTMSLIFPSPGQRNQSMPCFFQQPWLA